MIVILLSMSSYIVWQHTVSTTGYETGTVQRRRVNIKAASDSWDYFTSYYKIKTGRELSFSEVNSQLKNVEYPMLNSVVPLNELLKNPDRAILQNYEITGKIASKVKINSKTSNYAIISTNRGYVRVYYFFDLPPENNGDVVTIKGIVLGKPDDKQGDVTSFVSTTGFTKYGNTTFSVDTK